MNDELKYIFGNVNEWLKFAEAKQWYSEAFGIEPYFDEAFYVGFNIGGFELGLQPEKEKTANKTENVLVYWGVKNIHRTYERLIQLG